MSTVISVEKVSKQYRLGEVGTGTLSHDVNRWWHRLRGKEDPYLKIGESNDRSKKGDSVYSWALRDVSFEVKQGEVLGIIGRNGAGKSTLLKILSRVTTPTTGEVNVKGRIASLLEVGTGFHPELSGRENIFLNGAILGMRKTEIAAKFDEIVDFSGCGRYIDTPVKRYSSGMYVRLAFAVAAHLEPEILIVDEVLAVGDAEFQKRCLGKMKDVAGQGRTVLFVSHNMASIQALCTRAVLIEHGSIVYSDTTEKTIQHYYREAETTSDSDLSKWSAREGTGMGRFERVWLEDGAGARSSQFRGGDTASVCMQFTLPSPDSRYSIAMSIYGGDGTVIAHFDTVTSPAELPERASQITAKCQISLADLYPGDYPLNISLRDEQNRRMDRVEKACSICIVESDYHGTGRLPGKGTGFLLMPQKWVLLRTRSVQETETRA